MLRFVRLMPVLAVLLVSCLFATPAAALQSAKPATHPVVGSEVYRVGSYIGGPKNPAGRPIPVPGLQSIVTVEASNSSGYALECVGGKSSCTSDGIVWSSGDNNNGQLGNGSAGRSSSNPVRVKLSLPPGVGVVAIGEAKNEGFAVDSTGQGYGWGANGSGSLCIGNSKEQPTPVKIPLMAGVEPAAGSVQGGENHVLWLMANGDVEACGTNRQGQLGTGNTKASATPVAVRFPAGSSAIVQITAGNRSSGAVDSQGNAYMWGDNAFGQVGTASDLGGAVALPTRVAGLPVSVAELYAGGDEPNNGHTVALLTNHEAFAWGDDSGGQLGDGGSTNEDAPVEVEIPSGITFTFVAAGGLRSQGIDSGGNVWTFGKTHVGVSGVNMLSMTANNILYHLTP